MGPHKKIKYVRRYGKSAERFFKLWFPAIAWAALIFSFSATPYVKNGSFNGLVLRKIAHIAEYFIFTFLLYRAFNGCHLLSIFGLAVIYAASDEVHQSLVQGRNSSVADVVIDSIGIAIALMFIKYIGENTNIYAKTVLGTAMGGIIGFTVCYLMECAVGTCHLTGNSLISAAIGALIGSTIVWK